MDSRSLSSCRSHFRRRVLVLLCVLVQLALLPLSLGHTVHSHDNGGQSSGSKDVKYIIIVDAGSTGSRGFVYQLTNDRATDEGVQIEHLKAKGMKMTPGLSSFASRVEGVGEYLTPLFENAATVVPPAFQASTEVYILGTAGMRLVPENDQTRIWDQVVQSLNTEQRFPFHISRENVRTIHGREEAFYAALSTNYIAKRIDTNLMPVSGAKLVGALDMGGSSTQLVLHTGTPQGQRVSESHFWSHSWLNYGVEKVRERLWHHFVHVAKEPYMKVNQELDGSIVGENSHHSNIHIAIPEKHSHPPAVLNHCLFKNYTELYFDPAENKNEIYTLHGTGNAAKCKDALRNVLWPGGCVRDHLNPSCSLDGIPHPPIAGNSFFGMSVYYFALDCVRYLGVSELTHWPIANVRELISATESFCEMDWHDVNGTHDYSMNAEKGKHKKTSEEGLPFRCMEAMYLSLLLEEGFGFDLDQRSLTLALKVEGVEVEWTLGYLLTKAIDHANKPDSYEKNEIAEEIEVVDKLGTANSNPRMDPLDNPALGPNCDSTSDEIAAAAAMEEVKAKVRALKSSGLPAKTLAKLFPDLNMDEFFDDKDKFVEASDPNSKNKENTDSDGDGSDGSFAFRHGHGHSLRSSLRSRVGKWKNTINHRVIRPVTSTTSTLIHHSKHVYAPVAKSFEMFAQVIDIPLEFLRGRCRLLGKWLYRKLFELFHNRPL